MTNVTAAYERVCQSHDGIAEFRAKLLALLPLASGAGIFLLLGDPQHARTNTPHFLPVGIFGSFITVGLFIYELRGIQKCRRLIEGAKRLEAVLLPPELAEYGAFRCRPKAAFGGVVGAVGAALVIYPSVIGAWMYVASAGWTGVWWLPPAAAGLSFLFGFVVNWWEEKEL